MGRTSNRLNTSLHSPLFSEKDLIQFNFSIRKSFPGYRANWIEFLFLCIFFFFLFFETIGVFNHETSNFLDSRIFRNNVVSISPPRKFMNTFEAFSPSCSPFVASSRIIDFLLLLLVPRMKTPIYDAFLPFHDPDPSTIKGYQLILSKRISSPSSSEHVYTRSTD